MNVLILLPLQLIIAGSLVTLILEVRSVRKLLIDSQKEQVQSDFQRAITTPVREKVKIKLPQLAARKTTINGKVMVDQEELIDITDMPWEDAYKAVVTEAGVKE